MPTVVKVGFSSSNRLLSHIIKWATKSEVSHTFLYIEDSFLGTDMVLQATTGGFNLVSFKQFERTHTIVEMVDLAHPVGPGLKQAANWLGRHYDYTGLFGATFVLLGRWFKRKWRNPWNNSKAMFCSEAIVRVLQSSDYPGAAALDPSATTPQDLLLFLKGQA